MRERPILFSGAMVRALLDGTKTQTRRVVKPQFAADALPVEMPATDPAGGWVVPGHSGVWWCDAAANPDDLRRCPYGLPGDRLWVRETWQAVRGDDRARHICTNPQPDVGWLEYAATPREDEPAYKWRPSIHMPRWASRIDLEVTGVRVERLQDISEADADAEGCERLDSEREEHDWKLCPKCGGTRLHNALGPNLGVIFDVDCQHCDTYVKRYQHLWEAINGPGSWAANPWVWVVEFRRIRP